MRAPSFLVVAGMCLAPALALPVSQSGPCIVYTVDASSAIQTCLSYSPINFASCYSRVASCLKKACGLNTFPIGPQPTQAQMEACAAAQSQIPLDPETGVLKCVVGFEGGCPAYDFVSGW